MVRNRRREGNLPSSLLNTFEPWLRQSSSIIIQRLFPFEQRRALPLLGPAQIVLSLLAALWGGVFSRAAESLPRSDYIIDTWGIEEGLPNNTISSLAQTPDGYLWCGTYDGLVRFDGVRFVRMGPDDPSQQANRIQCLLVDRRGQLWLGTDGAGIFRFDGSQFTAVSQQPDLALSSVRCLEEDKTGDLWFGTRIGIGRLHDGAATWFTNTARFANAAKSTWNFLFDREDRLWIADWNGLKVFRGGRFESVVPRTELRPPVRALYRDSAGLLWAGMMGQALVRDQSNHWNLVDDQGQFGEAEVTAFCQTRSGQFWVGTRKALFRKDRDRWIAFMARKGLSSSEVRALFEDREGNLWIGTGAGGLARIKPRLLQTYAVSAGLGDGPVLGLAEKPGGKLWVGLEDGRLLEGNAGSFRSVEGLPVDAPIKTLLPTRDGALWVGTFGNGAFRIKNGEISRFVPSIGSPARVDKVLSLMEDRSGTVWVGTFYSFYRHTVSNQLQAVLVDGREIRAPVTALLQDRSGAVWVAFDGLGIVRLMGDRSAWLTREDGLPTHFVRALYEDAAATVWIGTASGLGCWRGGKLSVLTRANGLIDDSILQILEDASDNLWLGTGHGIMRVAKKDLLGVIDGKKASFEPFAAGRGEGMMSPECSGGFSPAGLKTSDGRLWFPTARGLTMADPMKLETGSNSQPPAVYIEEFRVDGKTIACPQAMSAWAKSNPSETFAVPAGFHRVQFDYTGLNLRAPDRIRFRYRLDGFDSQWREVGQERTAVFPNLSSGKYSFQVAACNQDGVWNQTGKAFTFVIATPFWRAQWFLALVAVTGAVAVAGVVRVVSLRHLRRRLRRLEEAHAIEKERMRIAQDMHDELGGKLSRISFLTDLARRNLSEPSESSQQIEEVSEAAREVIRTVDEIVWAVSPRNDSLESLTHYISRHAEEFFEMTDVELELELPDKFPGQQLSAEIRHNLFCAIKEALNNVLKHASATKVIISFRTSETAFEVAVVDNGVGFERSNLAKETVPTPSATVSSRVGNGLFNMHDRLQNVRGLSRIETHPGRGTRVVFSVPLA